MNPSQIQFLIRGEAFDIVEAVKADPENAGTGIDWTGKVLDEDGFLWYEISADGAEHMWCRKDGDEIEWRI